MCGRFVVGSSGSELVGVLRVDVVGDDLPQPSFNVAPTDRVAIVLDSAKTEPPTRRLEAARWGLIPGWAKDVGIGAKAINARAEEVENKPMFRQALIAWARAGEGHPNSRLAPSPSALSADTSPPEGDEDGSMATQRGQMLIENGS